MAKTELTKVTLATVAGDLRMWADTLEGLDGEDEATRETAMVEAAKSALQGKDKAERFGQFLLWIKDEIPRLRAEAERVRLKATALQNAQERIREYAVRSMRENDLKRIEGHSLALTRKGTGGKVVIEDEAAVPSRYKRLVLWCNAEKFEMLVQHFLAELGVDSIIDTPMAAFECKAVETQKSAVEAAIKSGAEVPGADFDPSAECLTVR